MAPGAATVGEGIILGIGLEEKIKRIKYRHLGDDIHCHGKVRGFFREDQTGLIIRERVLLPIDEVASRFDLEGV